MNAPRNTSKLKFVDGDAGKGVPLTLKEQVEASQAMDATRERMGHHFTPHQLLGKKSAIGCVSLEISQRCNLDCTLCYLTDESNQVHDLPLQEVFRRLDDIRKHFGVGTDVQISGGEPTLRDHAELVEIVRYARSLGLATALFTNGIKCSRDLLVKLSAAGLCDVAFHVDMTQKRPGFSSEVELNKLRMEYIDRARGLPLMVIFNTSVCHENFHEVPELASFFVKFSDRVGMASFQMQADTGRGSLRGRPEFLTPDTVSRAIEEGARGSLCWDAVQIGHPKCHRYAAALTVNEKVFNIIDDSKIFADFLNDYSDLTHDRREGPWNTFRRYLKAALKKPEWLPRVVRYFAPRFWSMREDLWAARGRVGKISFFIQNFMHADHLDPDRINACSFMVMTAQGPMSMCAHNARRNEFILPPIPVTTDEGEKMFYPFGDQPASRAKSR